MSIGSGPTLINVLHISMASTRAQLLYNVMQTKEVEMRIFSLPVSATSVVFHWAHYIHSELRSFIALTLVHACGDERSQELRVNYL